MPKSKCSLQSPMTFKIGSTMIIFGIGLMGQMIARMALLCMPIKKLILVDKDSLITVGTGKKPLDAFARSMKNPNGVKIITAAIDATDEVGIRNLFKQHRGIDYLMITTGISGYAHMRPEQLKRDDFIKVMLVNTFGPLNILNQAVKAKALSRSSKGVIMLSTSATHSAQGRASILYELSKSALAGLVLRHAWYWLKRGLVLNGISPNPLKGPMASGNAISRRRVAQVIRETPLGLTTPTNIGLQTLSFLSNECNSVGQNIVVCGGYTLPRIHYGDLPGQKPKRRPRVSRRPIFGPAVRKKKAIKGKKTVHKMHA